MSNPNISNPLTIYGGYASSVVTNSLTSVVTNSASSGKVYKINSIYAANVQPTLTEATLDVCINDGTTDRYIAKNITVPRESTQVILSRDIYLYLLEGYSLKVKSSQSNSSIHLTVVYDDVYAQESLVTDGLIFHVDAANSSSYSGSGTTWNDLSGQNNDMTLTSAPSHTSGSGGYFQFDGVNDTASVSLSDFNSGHNPISIEMWVNIDDTDTDYRHIFGTREISSSDDCAFYTLLLNGANSTKIEARLATSSGNTDLVYDLGSNWNSWRQIVFTYDTSDDKTRLYVNGSLVSTSSGTNSGSFGTANPFTVARTSHNVYTTNMKGSKFLIYTKALSLSEVQANYDFYKDEFGLS